MKPRMVMIGIFFAGGTLSTGAFAQNYPWCAYYSTGDGNATNCGFATHEQCEAAVSGIGGYCERNNMYVPPRTDPSEGTVSTSKPYRR